MQEIFRFLKNPRKPAILAMSRPDAKKNITTLVKAFGENAMLRELANLVLIMVCRCRTLKPAPIQYRSIYLTHNTMANYFLLLQPTSCNFRIHRAGE